MAPHFSTLAWKVAWMEEPGRLPSMGSLRVGNNWATSLSLFLSCIGEGNGNPLQCSCLENPRDGGAWWAAVYGVAQSQTRLKWLSSSSRLYSLVSEVIFHYCCHILFVRSQSLSPPTFKNRGLPKGMHTRTWEKLRSILEGYLAHLAQAGNLSKRSWPKKKKKKNSCSIELVRLW